MNNSKAVSINSYLHARHCNDLWWRNRFFAIVKAELEPEDGLYTVAELNWAWHQIERRYGPQAGA